MLTLKPMAGSPLKAPKEMRFRWYRQVEEAGKRVDDACDIFGISRKTYYKWYRKDHGLGPNEYKSRSVHPKTKIIGQIRVLIVEAKEKYNYGPKKVQFYLKREAKLKVSTTAIYRFMKKKNLIRKPQKKQLWYRPMKRKFRTRIPGRNVQLDVKYVPDGHGYWNYQYRFMDSASNMQYALDFEQRDARTTIRAIQSAERYLPFKITGIQTDNGGEFRGAFHLYLAKRRIKHRFIPKRSAPWNGKVERANRSVDDEYYLNFGRPWRRLRDYTDWYNYERFHLGRNMNGCTPHEKYLALSKKVSPLKVN